MPILAKANGNELFWIVNLLILFRCSHDPRHGTLGCNSLGKTQGLCERPRRDGIIKCSFLVHILDICKNQLIDFQAFTYLKLPVLLRSEREHERLVCCFAVKKGPFAGLIL